MTGSRCAKRGPAGRPLGVSLCAVLIAGLAAGNGGCSDDASRRARPIGSTEPAGPLSAGKAPSQAEAQDATVCEDGETMGCHVDLGAHNGIHSCFEGERECIDGVWSACGAQRSSASAGGAAQGSLAGGSGMKTLSNPPGCPSNPCDPYCQTISEPSADYVPDEMSQAAYQTGNVANLPGGFQDKGLKDADHPPSGPCTAPEHCQFDEHCDVASGLCVPWRPGETDPTCAGIDLTLGPTCNGSIPVCNRGSQSAPAGVEVVVFPGNQQQVQDDLGECSSYRGDGSSRCHTDAEIPPGGCVTIAGCVLGGTESIVVNPASPPATVAPVAECQCGNNWTIYHNGGACQSTEITVYQKTTIKRSFSVDCPPGARPQWGYLSYETSVPANSSGSSAIMIEVHSAQSPNTPDPTCADCAVLAVIPAQAPALCSMAGPAPCPLDVYAALGGEPTARNDTVELVFTLSPSPDGLAAPTLDGFELTYSCAPTE